VNAAELLLQLQEHSWSWSEKEKKTVAKLLGEVKVWDDGSCEMSDSDKKMLVSKITLSKPFMMRLKKNLESKRLWLDDQKRLSVNVNFGRSR
jgi:hypothetical protein